MTIRPIALSTILALGMGLGAGLTTASAAPYLQPGMRTMIQQGGVEGTVLGDLFRPPHVVYVPVYVPVERPGYGVRVTLGRRAAWKHRRYAPRHLQHYSAR